MIKIKAFFGNWKEVDKEQAKKFITHFMSGITTTSDINKKIAMYKLYNSTDKEIIKTNLKNYIDKSDYKLCC